MEFVLTGELARRIERSEVEALESRLTVTQGISGNPMDITLKKFGSATAFTAKNIPGPLFNIVKGLCDGDIEHIDSILEFYRQSDTPVRFEITPAHSSYELFAYLAKEGLFQSYFHTALYGLDNRIYEKSNPLISIHTLEKNDIFADIYTKGFNHKTSRTG